ncbi:TPA: DUF1146 family protein [Streptococcus suis]|nr:DUF1146 family protein [Streptococcus suis]
MMTSILAFSSHLLFIYLSYHLLITTVDWSKWLKVTAENQGRIRLLLVFLAIGLGYLVSVFFLEILAIGRTLAQTFYASHQ